MSEQKMRETLERLKADLRIDDPNNHYDLVCEALSQREAQELPCFAKTVIQKLQRFAEQAEDSEASGTDIGRHWLDILTRFGLLNRIKRSPAVWEISQQGEDLLEASQPADGEAVTAIENEAWSGLRH